MTVKTNSNDKNHSDDTSQSIEQFLISIEKRAFVMARVATACENEALDIVQDAMFKLVSKYSNKKSEEWPPLFYRILQSHINDWYRRQKVRNRWRSWFLNDNSDQHDNQYRDAPLENKQSDNDKLPEDELKSMEFSDSLEQAVTALPLRQKQAFMLRAWEECSTAETSEIMKCSQGSVKTHYSRALASLRNNLEEFSNDSH